MSDLKHNLEECRRLYPAVGGLNPRGPGLRNHLIQFAKRVMRRSLSWYTRPIQHFEAAVIRTLDGLVQSHDDLTVQAEKFKQLESSWRQNVPAFLNAVSTVNAFGYELVEARRQLERQIASVRQQLDEESEAGLPSLSQDIESRLQSVCQEARQESEQELKSLRGGLQQTNESIVATWERIEFVRCEMMYEMKYGRQGLGAAFPLESNRVEPRIVSLKKVAAARQLGLKLNLGCGHLPLEGYVNVDRRELPGVDVVADVADLGFDEGSVEEIFASHLLEHFPEEMLRRRLIPTWRSLLAPGGVFRAVVPDGEAMLAGVAAGTYSFSDFRAVLFGAQEYSGDFHFNLFTPDRLCSLLEEAGFADIRVNARARLNGRCFEFDVSATKPPHGGLSRPLSHSITDSQ